MKPTRILCKLMLHNRWDNQWHWWIRMSDAAESYIDRNWQAFYAAL